MIKFRNRIVHCQTNASLGLEPSWGEDGQQQRQTFGWQTNGWRVDPHFKTCFCWPTFRAGCKLVPLVFFKTRLRLKLVKVTLRWWTSFSTPRGWYTSSFSEAVRVQINFAQARLASGQARPKCWQFWLSSGQLWLTLAGPGLLSD